MPTQKFTSINTVEELQTVINNVTGLINDPAEQAKLDRALKQATNAGMPNADDYSLKHINASSEEDFNLKLTLAALPVLAAFVDNKIPMSEMQEQIQPLLHAFLVKAMQSINFNSEVANFSDLEYPVEIRVEE